MPHELNPPDEVQSAKEATCPKPNLGHKLHGPETCCFGCGAFVKSELEDEIARLTEENPPGWYECTPKGKFFSRVMWWTGKELRLGPGHDAYVAFEGTKFRGPLVHADRDSQPAAKGGANG